MCGIVGYVGSNSSQDVLLGGLRRLEYRGYDSAGIAVVDPAGDLVSAKKAGKLQALVDELESSPIPDGTTGIGHTRWATHGGPTDGNAHPHLADGDKLALIHNGIIENFSELRAELQAEGIEFRSETDSEVAAHLVGRAFRDTGDLTAAMQQAVQRLEGAFTLLVVHADQPGVVVGARRNSPLVVGLGDGENFMGSDVAAFVAYTQRALSIGQDEIATIRPDGVDVIHFDGTPATPTEFEVNWDASAADKGGWSSFMAKEISEEPEAVAKTILGRVHDGAVTLTDLDPIAERLATVDRVIVIACGTAAYAGILGKYAIEQWARIPVEVELAHEFRYRDPVLNERTLVVSISQSGETMDTLMAVKYAREQGAQVLSICNTQGATIPRESDAVIYTHAGPEVAVASTKAFIAQGVALYLLGLHLATLRGTLTTEQIAEQVAELEGLAPKLQQTIEDAAGIKDLARWMADTRSVLFLGRHVGYPIALEGALKLKELAYIHAEGFAAGELKHGPIALIEPGQIVFVIVPSPRDPRSLHPKVVSNIQEIRARGARVIAIAEEGDAAVLPFADEVLRIPLATPLFEPLLAVAPLHMFGMELAAAKGLDVDQPRNLAKSVTVE
ncbi:glutamine--fructose-6-phosphate aminotransferase [Curtobacterium sp. MCBA15_007]|jgi:glucosamine--fructose-6-phosphate aminotransferase (isomerizing)|uniref:Glutamine--fructose-6-phosphate aminotransferase [isomerizing] n=1 Tax=Curtobacterium flaccumfaciens pv. flaccumfaciens TaxID=138532 RepID=A0A9Q2W533_9MICO|nr:MULTISPECIES: glutamine--fructose-6-phosphate transaminase (isomerizing) [Curtobacterium]KIQ11816.1 glutamine amidotransferase [Curtobacterium flaccumfaciens]MBF4593851.1 glutamine--fructose-6-phosphate transaminase (isomerizing) [Curtobacterium flaccumfaciens]MBF4626745.1 glutamine--fructose-6-phosphate transaminase (isomerizing) [Curtobacterium flaccumfaciens]MBO9051245.1 glutamine--fructose-6-phosphate transaminase (isomerizing) [Curtobacterium flaccumfaciens pv. flaccumfaciens]MBT154240